MNARSAPPTVRLPEDVSRVWTLKRMSLVLAQILWLGMEVVNLGLYLTTTSVRYQELLQLPPEEVQALARLGLTPDAHATFQVVTEHALLVVFVAICFFLFWRRSNDWIVLFVTGFLLSYTVPVVAPNGPVHRLFLDWVGAFGVFAYILMFIFPDGRFIPRWTRWVALFWGVWVLLRLIFPLLNPVNWPAPGIGPGGVSLAELLPEAAMGGIGLYALVYRYRWFSDSVQRQQTKWVVFGVAVLVIGYILAFLPETLSPILGEPGMPHLIYRTIRKLVLVLSRIALPVTIAFSVLRYHLWDIDLIINRTIVYGAMTGTTMGMYILIVGLFGSLFRISNLGDGMPAVIPFLTTGLIAIAFQPLRDYFQKGVNRLMYGERDTPYAVLSRLGQRLEASLAPEATFQVIVETVAQALKLPYAAIALREGESFNVVAEFPSRPTRFPQTREGKTMDEDEILPLIYQAETIGQLILGHRAPGESFTPADRRLVEDIAHQSGVVAHSIRLTADLQRSRERLVNALEEERRRMRRDLHDGLGPVLASQGLKLAAARQLLERDPSSTDTLISQVMAQNEKTVADIRRLVYALRPPALDELGLVEAVRDYAAEMDSKADLQDLPQIRVEVAYRSGFGRQTETTSEISPDLPLLSAAVEVAAYRIALEALTNTARHARASHCLVRFQNETTNLGEYLILEVADDGVGLHVGARAGVGLTSMRERAEEVGGSLTVESVPERGTRVIARLPIIRDGS